MEYRVFLKIPGIEVADEAAWEKLISRLERDYNQFGPVIGFYEGGAEVVVSMDCATEADAASRGVEAIASSLLATGLGAYYPGSVTIEAITADELATA
jgi:hypothetical protein